MNSWRFTYLSYDKFKKMTSFPGEEKHHVKKYWAAQPPNIF